MARAARHGAGRIRLAVTGAVAVTALTVGTAAALPPTQVATQAQRQTRPDPSTASSTRTPSPGFLLDKGRFTTFDVPGARVGTSPLGINNRGQIVGSYGNISAMPNPQRAGMQAPTGTP
jgi:hypothetical protein